MNEFLIMGHIIFCGVFFALGGTGYKWIRRFGIPAITFIVMNKYVPFDLVTYLGAIGVLTVGLHLGYGEGRSWITRGLVGFSMVAGTMFIQATVWLAITTLVWLGMFWLSNLDRTHDQMPWKIVETLMGCLIGASYVGAIQSYIT